ncbi:MAG: zinc-ribbon domain-containing protein [Methylophilaceae bacterium]|nr:zinc-ribbon domain-containing protein [Methylophilaceae bacterium]
MSYITSCPQCDTQFLLNDELIAAYGGKVQCGSCEHVFNASDRLTEVDDDVSSADEYKVAIETTPAEKTPPVNRLPPVETASFDTDPDLTASKETLIDYIIGQPAATVNPTAEKEAAPEAVLNLDGVNKKSRQHFFLSILISLLLLLVFIGLSVYFLRGKIASEYPQLKPALERICKMLNCTIDLPKNLGLISIGNSDMQEDDDYQAVINLSSSLQNNATYSQAYPNIELTLTDSDDTPVIKKLIKPKDYLVSKKKLAQGLAPHEIANIKIALRVDEASVASYRILLLY